MAWWKSPVMPVSAVRNRLPKEWPSRPPPFGKRYWKSRVSRSSSSASAAMQLRMSPGGSTPNSRRSRPEEPPSSVTVTTPASSRSRTLPTWCLRPRNSAERPVPPPIATRDLAVARAESGEAEERTVVPVLAELGEVGVVEGIDAILRVQLDRLGEPLRRLFQPVLQGVDRRREIGEALVLLVAPAPAADLQRLLEVTAVLLVDGLEVRIGVLAPRGLRLLGLRLLPAGGEELPGALAQLRPVRLRDGLLQQVRRLLPILLLQGREPLRQGIERRIGVRCRRGAPRGLRFGLGFRF